MRARHAVQNWFINNELCDSDLPSQIISPDVTTDQNSARSAELPRCSTSRQECPPCLPPLNIHQSRSIQSWVANPSLQPSLQHPLRTFCFKSVLYLLTTEREDMVSRPSPYNGVSMQYLVWTMLPPFLKVWCVPIPELWCIVSEL